MCIRDRYISILPNVVQLSKFFEILCVILCRILIIEPYDCGVDVKFTIGYPDNQNNQKLRFSQKNLP